MSKVTGFHHIHTSKEELRVSRGCEFSRLRLGRVGGSKQRRGGLCGATTHLCSLAPPLAAEKSRRVVATAGAPPDRRRPPVVTSRPAAAGKKGEHRAARRRAPRTPRLGVAETAAFSLILPGHTRQRRKKNSRTGARSIAAKSRWSPTARRKKKTLASPNKFPRCGPV